MATHSYPLGTYPYVMTRTKTNSFVGSVPADLRLRRRRKAVMSCPRCQHTDTTDGSWICDAHEDAVDIRCPVCHELLTTRPPCTETQ